MRVVIIGHLLPEPASSAAGSRMLELISFFREADNEVVFASAAQNVTFSIAQKDLDAQLVTIELNSDSFNAQIKALDPEVVLFDRYLTEEQYGWRVAEACPNALRILDTEDLHCLRQARRDAVKAERPFERADLNNEIAKREIAAIFRADLSLIISEAEIDLLTSHFQVKDALLHYLPFLPAQKEANDAPPFEERSHFMTIGNFLHPPNIDGVEYVQSTIWPLIRKGLPTAEMHVYGAYPPQRILQLHKPQNGFYVHGRIASAQDAFTKARVCLAPLRFGAGMKGKLLEAMLFSTPSVTTSIGAEGMHGDLAWGGSISDAPESIAKAAIALHEKKDAWQNAVSNGRAILKERFNTSDHKALLQSRLTALKTDLVAHRNENFIGQMLHHHQHKSTEFMSRFIALKNQKGA